MHLIITWMRSNVHAPNYNVDTLERGCTTTHKHPNLKTPTDHLTTVLPKLIKKKLVEKKNAKNDFAKNIKNP